MVRRPLASTLLCVLLPGSGSMARTSQDWHSLIEKVRSLDCIVSSTESGFAHDTPGPFYRLSKEVIRDGNEIAFKALLLDREPIVRCMGLLALAQTRGRDGIDLIENQLSDGTWVRHQVDDIRFSCPVSTFAWQLLKDAACLEGMGHACVPLLSEKEQTALKIRVLASDRTTPLHRMACGELGRTIQDGYLSLDWATLKEYVPTLKDYRIVKGIGRAWPVKAQWTFLAECVRSQTLDPESRLAAASALTRYSDNETLRVLKAEEASLNQIDGQGWGTRLLEVLNIRRAQKKNLETLRKLCTGPTTGTQEKNTIPQVTDHPLALEYALEADPFVPFFPSGRLLVAISRNLKGCAQPWNTYSDAAYRLDAMILQLREGEESWRRTIVRSTDSGRMAEDPGAARQAEALLELGSLPEDPLLAEIEKNISGLLTDVWEPVRYK